MLNNPCLVCWVEESAEKTFLSALFLSACAESRGLCPWMNAQNVDEAFMHRRIDAPADFAMGG